MSWQTLGLLVAVGLPAAVLAWAVWPRPDRAAGELPAGVRNHGPERHG